MATHSSILAWEIPWTAEPGGLQSMGVTRVRHNLVTKPLPPSVDIDTEISSVQSVMSNSLRPHELQHARLPCPSPTPGVHVH